MSVTGKFYQPAKVNGRKRYYKIDKTKNNQFTVQTKIYMQSQWQVWFCKGSPLQSKMEAGTYLYNVRVSSALMWFVILCVFQQNFVHVCAGVLEELVRAVENDEGDLTIAQYAELIGLFHQAKLPLCEGNLRGTQKTKPSVTEEKS